MGPGTETKSRDSITGYYLRYDFFCLIIADETVLLQIQLLGDKVDI